MKILITEDQLNKLKKNINEQGFGDYPAGAENDPNAPWNQEDTPEAEFENIEIIDDDVDEFEDVWVLFKNDRGGEAEYQLSNILNNIDLSNEQKNYFGNAIKQYPRPNDWEEKIKEVAYQFERQNNIEYSGERDYEPYSKEDDMDYREDW